MSGVPFSPRLSRRRLVASLAPLALAGACAPTVMPAGPPVAAPRLATDAYIAADGTRLPVRVWPAREAGPPRAIVLGVHGFGDYSIAFDDPARTWAGIGIETWAWDQRGFGNSPSRGLWAGVPSMEADLRAIAGLLRARYPDRRIVAVGESMGAALVIAAMGTPPGLPGIDAAVIVAPAARTRESVGPVGTAILAAAAHAVPWLPVGPSSIDFQPTDNRAMLERLSKDRLMLRNPRTDMVYGLVDLMDAAYAAAPAVRQTLLVLYGNGDRVVPPRPTQKLLRRLPETPELRLAWYEHGFHMLFRDLQGEVVARDVAAWIADPAAPLPSGAERSLAALAKDK